MTLETDRFRNGRLWRSPEVDGASRHDRILGYKRTRGLKMRLDHLALSRCDLLSSLAQIADKRAGFHSLTDAWAGSTTARGRLMLTVLGRLAEF